MTLLTSSLPPISLHPNALYMKPTDAAGESEGKKMDEDEVSGARSGSSLPVPNVQALAAASDGSGEIPHRYIRPEIAAAPVTSDGHVELPIIDLSRLLDSQFYQEESVKLKIACEQWGFFQLINHGVPEELMNKVKADITEFFKLPLEIKKEFAQLPNSLEGYGQAFVMSEEQKLDWADRMYIITQPPASRSSRFWPAYPPTFRDTLDKYSASVKEVANCLFGLMSKSLGLDQKIILNIFKDRMQAMRINYYPPCPKAEMVIGLSPHTDADGLTLLLQLSETQGLQINKDGNWLPIKVIPGALIVNIGDILEIMSNGRFRSVEHRAMINPVKERISIAAFHSPSNRVTVGPLPELVKSCEKKYKSMSYEEYMKTFLSARLDGRSLLESMKFTN